MRVKDNNSKQEKKALRSYGAWKAGENRKARRVRKAYTRQLVKEG